MHDARTARQQPEVKIGIAMGCLFEAFVEAIQLFEEGFAAKAVGETEEIGRDLPALAGTRRRVRLELPAQHVDRVGQRGQALRQPVRCGDGLVVGERDDRRTRAAPTEVARCCRAMLAGIGQVDQLRAALERTGAPAGDQVQGVVVRLVIDDDDLIKAAGQALTREGVEAAVEQIHPSARWQYDRYRDRARGRAWLRRWHVALR